MLRRRCVQHPALLYIRYNMKHESRIVDAFPSPCYVMEEVKLRENLELISCVARESGAEIILALKAFALWRSFPIFKEYIRHTTASSLYEARLSAEEFGDYTHTYSPAYDEATFGEILKYSGHVTMNSLSQLVRFMPYLKGVDHSVSLGLRINPEYSEIETELYNPCAPGSRFGVLAKDLPDELPAGLDGFHFHCLCENDAPSLVKVLENVESRFGKWLPHLKWLNMGGGHLMTRQGYHLDLLIDTLRQFRQRHPNLQLFLEPGSAFLWGTGYLQSNVMDIVDNNGIKTAILNVSFTCHMPDCLEMPYYPTVRGAETIPEDTCENSVAETPYLYRLGGNSCLSGDYMGFWKFDHELRVGDTVIFEDMIHYTTVKTNMFNGVSHPSIALLRADRSKVLMRQFGYEDYRDRMC